MIDYKNYEREEIIQEMIEQNSWWKRNFIIEYHNREILKEIKKFIKLKQIIALTGLRRVGKTTILFKIIKDLLKEQEPTNILYFSFDIIKNAKIRMILEIFSKLNNIDLKKNKTWLFFDEIQKLNDWENQIKYIYDLYPKMKIFISGSASLDISKKSSETLAGRIYIFKVNPLTFKEFLGFKQIKINNLKLYKKEIIDLWEKYIHTQGLPELVRIDEKNEKEIIIKYITESLLEKIFYKDIPQMYSIKNIEVLRNLYYLIANNPGQIVESSHLASDLHVTRQTISNYLEYLENSYLIKKLYNFSRDLRKSKRKMKKYYPMLIPNSLTFDINYLIKSQIFEWALITRELDVEYFWRDSSNKEIDAIKILENKTKKKKIFPIEIKYGKVLYKNLKYFMKKFDINEGMIISFDFEKTLIEKVEDKEYILKVEPFFKYLLKN